MKLNSQCGTNTVSDTTVNIYIDIFIYLFIWMMSYHIVKQIKGMYNISLVFIITFLKYFRDSNFL